MDKTEPNPGARRQPSPRELLDFFKQSAPPEVHKAMAMFNLLQPSQRMELLMFQALATSLELDMLKKALNGMAFTLQLVKQHLEALASAEDAPKAPQAESPQPTAPVDQDTLDRYRRQIDADHKDGEA